MSEMEVIHAEEASRYEVTVGGKLAGFVDYVAGDGTVALTHTEVDDAFGGQGVGGRLAEGALDDVRRQGLKAKPVCPFIKGYIEKHAEYQDLVAS